MYIKHKEIKYVEFSRIGTTTSSGTGRHFDLSIIKIDSESGNETFKNIDKRELKNFMQYFRVAGIKMRQLDGDTNKSREMEDFNSDELDEEIKNSQREETKTDK